MGNRKICAGEKPGCPAFEDLGDTADELACAGTRESRLVCAAHGVSGGVGDRQGDAPLGVTQYHEVSPRQPMSTQPKRRRRTQKTQEAETRDPGSAGESRMPSMRGRWARSPPPARVCFVGPGLQGGAGLP